MANRRAYAKHHGYTALDIMTPRELDAAYWHNSIDPYWLKVAALRQLAATATFDWLLYTDTDFHVLDFARPLDAFLPSAERLHNSSVSLVVPQERSDSRTFSNFVTLVRTDPVGRHFLDLWWEERQHCNSSFPDQVAQWSAITSLLAGGLAGAMSGSQQTDHPCRAVCHQLTQAGLAAKPKPMVRGLASCVDSYLARWRIQPDGTARRMRCRFAPIDLYLGETSLGFNLDLWLQSRCMQLVGWRYRAPHGNATREESPQAAQLLSGVSRAFGLHTKTIVTGRLCHSHKGPVPSPTLTTGRLLTHKYDEECVLKEMLDAVCLRGARSKQIARTNDDGNLSAVPRLALE
mmetsp:Transcript_25418/g.57892  ORF Transcript_25418/g.57892 Transcript_25418/m.57892 type:complete len:347 (-) Transcript_25418:194-1234(-)